MWVNVKYLLIGCWKWRICLFDFHVSFLVLFADKIKGGGNIPACCRRKVKEETWNCLILQPRGGRGQRSFSRDRKQLSNQLVRTCTLCPVTNTHTSSRRLGNSRETPSETEDAVRRRNLRRDSHSDNVLEERSGSSGDFSNRFKSLKIHVMIHQNLKISYKHPLTDHEKTPNRQ